MKINSIYRWIKVISVTYIIFLLSISCRKDELPTVLDIDGNEYHYVTIGSQKWMVENLRTTKYRNGDPIPEIDNNSEWSILTSGAYCNYNNDINSGRSYGFLYNWYVVQDIRNIAPLGWHVATVDEWNSLINFLGGFDIAGGKLKEEGTAHWISPDGRNTVGFSALPSGLRDNHGIFSARGEVISWWIPKNYDTLDAWFVQISNGTSIQISSYGQKSFGSSIRCIKD